MGDVAMVASNASKHKFQRTTFLTSREMDFFSEKELITQTGHEKDEWPLVLVKELIDNALDAGEEADIAPVIEVAADAGGITVADNGPGLPEATLRGAMDFTVRASNREAYVSPCRGAQGNALKTLLPLPWVLDPDQGHLVVIAQGKRHEVRCGADPISQRPAIIDDVAEVPKSKDQPDGGDEKACFTGGTEVRLEWPGRVETDHGMVLWPFGVYPVADRETAAEFRALVEGYAVFNPHATIRLDWF